MSKIGPWLLTAAILVVGWLVSGRIGAEPTLKPRPAANIAEADSDLKKK